MPSTQPVLHEAPSLRCLLRGLLLLRPPLPPHREKNPHQVSPKHITPALCLPYLEWNLCWVTVQKRFLVRQNLRETTQSAAYPVCCCKKAKHSIRHDLVKYFWCYSNQFRLSASIRVCLASSFLV